MDHHMDQVKLQHKMISFSRNRAFVSFYHCRVPGTVTAMQHRYKLQLQKLVTKLFRYFSINREKLFFQKTMSLSCFSLDLKNTISPKLVHWSKAIFFNESQQFDSWAVNDVLNMDKI